MESPRKKRMLKFSEPSKKFKVSFFLYGAVSYCNNADELLRALGCDRKSGDWLLFFVSSNFCVESDLPHNGNYLPAIAAGHAVHMKERREKNSFA
jgi:hypothetical protein